MPAGIQLFNSVGGFTVDGLYRNYSMISKQSLSTSSTASPRSLSVSVSVNANTKTPPILAVYCNQPCLITGPTVSGTSYTWSLVSFTDTGTFAVDAYAFADYPVSASDGGIQVFDEAGALVFDGANKYLRVLGMVSGQSNPPDPVDFGVGKAAFFVNQMKIVHTCSQAGPSAPNDYTRGLQTMGAVCSAGKITFMNMNTGSVNRTPCAAGENFSEGGFSFTVVDVSNF